MTINGLIIETTRRCNMKCQHCLRGPAQSRDMDLKYVETLFKAKELDYVGSVVFTGGEPSLVPEIITGTIELAKKHGVSFGNFYIATNGKKISEEFLIAVIKLYHFCDDNEISAIEFSNDKYHDWQKNEAWKLEAFKFYGVKANGTYPINEGHAAKNGLGKRGNSLESLEVDEYSISEPDIYLNCLGNIVLGCDWSYKSQNEKGKYFCHVRDFWKKIRKIQKENEDEESLWANQRSRHSLRLA